MFNRELKSEKLPSVIYLFLVLPLVTFSTGSIGYGGYYSDYYGYSSFSADGVLVLAGFFLSLTVKERYLQYLFQLIATTQLLTMVFQEILSNNFGNTSRMIALLLGVIALGVSVKVFVDHKISVTIFIKGFFNRVQTTPHVIFGRVFAVLALLSALGSGIIALTAMDNGRYSVPVLYNLINAIASILISLLIAEVIFFLISKNWNELASIKVALDDTTLNTYITRTLSSWTYLATRHFLFIAAVVAVPYTMSSLGIEWLPFFGGFFLLPLYILFAYLVLMMIRLFFEYSNALIHIVQNTSK